MLRSSLVIQNEVVVELIDGKTGEVVQSHRAHNVFTDVGRNYIASAISYALLTQPPGIDEPATSKRRYDGVRYMMVGKGSQPETVAVVQLNDPVPFNLGGDFLAQIIAPNELPGTGISAIFQRIYGLNEISMPGTVYVSEAGLFVSGPSSAPQDVSDKFAAPIAYHTFPAVPKTAAFLLSIRWEIKL